ncbi:MULTISPECIES: aminotransferase class IV [unclassified Salinibacterium]|uniref:aminotransferase class IV n=1 Tax=unclassified Salinibacterium TaxID=2632331 RepID=UPI001420B8C5|nr:MULTISPECIES: aminotransferase class IV [unclassified Salinibacterium]
MSALHPSPAASSLWTDSELVPRDDCDVHPARTLVADSWLVADGSVRGLDLHRERFLRGIPADAASALDARGFWDASIAALPREGDWFPRVELREQRGAPQLLLRIREAPARSRSLVLATHDGRDPRTQPATKGPDLSAMLRLRTEVQAQGADDAVILSPEGHIVDGSTTALCWWRGSSLCFPEEGLERVDSVTLRSILALATALGIATSAERATPDELDGLEVWAVNALHGVRIVTAWRGGPAQLAEEPGRLATWELRLNALRRPMPHTDIRTPSAPERST